MSDAPIVATYKGRPAHTLTHAELVEAYTYACEELARYRKSMANAAAVARAEAEVAEAFALRGWDLDPRSNYLYRKLS